MGFLIGDIEISDSVCISLQDNKDERQRVLDECSKYNFEPKFYITEKHPTSSVQGCLESHLYCIRYAQRNNLENILILEDDVRFEKTSDDLKDVKFPKKYDIIYLGYNPLTGYKYDANFLKINSTLTTHAYILHKSMYTYILENIEKNWNELPEYSQLSNIEQPFFVKDLRAIDLFYAKWINHHKGNSYGVYPMIAYQNAGFSSIENKIVDYADSFRQRADALSQQYHSTFIGMYNYDLFKYSKMDIVKKHRNTCGKFDYVLVYGKNDREFAESIEVKNMDIYASNSWDIYYFSPSIFFIRMSYNEQLYHESHSFPRIDNVFPVKFNKNTITKKPILCVYSTKKLYSFDQICSMINGNMTDFDIYFCSPVQNKFAENITCITPTQYEFLPKHELLIIDDITFFIDQPMTHTSKIHLYMSKSRFHQDWKGIPVPFDGTSLFFNMRHHIDSIVCMNEDIMKDFKLHYSLTSRNIFISKFNSNFSKKLPNSIVCDYHDTSRDLYIKWFKELTSKLPNLNLKLYIYNSKRKLTSSDIFYMKGKIEFKQYEMYFCNNVEESQIIQSLQNGIVAIGNHPRCAIQSTQELLITSLCEFIQDKHRKQIFIDNIYQIYNDLKFKIDV